MSACQACEAEQDDPTLAHTCEATIDVLFVSADQFLRIPQVGNPRRQTFSELCRTLAKPVTGDRKDVAGAYSPALYTENIRRKSNLVHVCCLVIDIDEGKRTPRTLAPLFVKRRAVIHTTFNSTPELPRCRILVELSTPIDVITYDKLHAHYRGRLKNIGIIADTGAKDASRLSYLPVVKPGQVQETITTDGEPVDGAGLVASLPPEPPRPPPVIIPPDHRDKYIRGALRKAADNLASTAPGLRHYTLAREAWGLARLDLTVAEVEAGLLPAWVACAGEARRDEGVRTIRGQVTDRNGQS